jgi:hypothetical protein
MENLNLTTCILLKAIDLELKKMLLAELEIIHSQNVA